MGPLSPAHGVLLSKGSGRRLLPGWIEIGCNPATCEVYAGLTKVVRNVQLTDDLQTFRAVSVQEQYDPQGTLIATLRATEEGWRLPMGEIPDQP